jgi:hypothetical protein
MDETREAKRGFLWWLTAITAPIGIFGGPLAIANMLSDVIRWKGWIAYLVSFWDENIAGPFRTVIAFVALRLSLPIPPAELVDYLILGVLMAVSIQRALQLVGERQSILARLSSVFFSIIIWPAAIFALFIAALFPAVHKFPETWLTLAPFGLFLALYAVNAILA